MKYSYFSLQFINLAFHKLNIVNIINLEFRKEKNSISNKEAFIVPDNSFSPLKNLTLSQFPFPRNNLWKNQMTWKWVCWAWGLLRFILNLTFVLAHLYSEHLNTGCHWSLSVTCYDKMMVPRQNHYIAMPEPQDGSGNWQLNILWQHWRSWNS